MLKYLRRSIIFFWNIGPHFLFYHKECTNHKNYSLELCHIWGVQLQKQTQARTLLLLLIKLEKYLGKNPKSRLCKFRGLKPNWRTPLATQPSPAISILSTCYLNFVCGSSSPRREPPRDPPEKSTFNLLTVPFCPTAGAKTVLGN